MKMIVSRVIAGLLLSAVLAATALPAAAQSAEVKEKPRLYTYAGDWIIPRQRWADMEKDNPATQKIFDHAVANGSVVAYGDSITLVHTADGPTHTGWWCAMSMAGLLNTLDEFYKSGSSVSPVLVSATKHWDEVYVSRFYNWHAGSVKGGYVHGATYLLKADAPRNALETLSKNLFVPLFEKLVADGTVTAYQVAEQTIHTADPNLFFIFFLTPNAEGLDKVAAATREAVAANELAVPAIGSMVDFTPHRDYLARGNATFK